MKSRPDSRDRARRIDEILSQPAGAVAGEYKVLTFRRHARHLIWPALIFIVLAGIVPYYAGTFLEPWQNWAFLAGAALLVMLSVIGPFLGWLARTTTVSTKRIIVRSGVLTRHRSDFSLAQIRELKLKRGPLQRMFGAGDIVLQPGVGDPLVLRNVPRVKVVAQAIQELIEWQYASQQFAVGLPARHGHGSSSFASG